MCLKPVFSTAEIGRITVAIKTPIAFAITLAQAELLIKGYLNAKGSWICSHFFLVPLMFTSSQMSEHVQHTTSDMTDHN